MAYQIGRELGSGAPEGHDQRLAEVRRRGEVGALAEDVFAEALDEVEVGGVDRVLADGALAVQEVAALDEGAHGRRHEPVARVRDVVGRHRVAHGVDDEAADDGDELL